MGELSTLLWEYNKCLGCLPPVGVIVTAREFDRERQREYAVTVTATDKATEPLIGICQLNILILDENDNSPKFENLRYECEYQLWTNFLQVSITYVMYSSSQKSGHIYWKSFVFQEHKDP